MKIEHKGRHQILLITTTLNTGMWVVLGIPDYY